MSEPRESSLADLLACIAAFGRSMQAVFDPQRFLAEFSARAQRLVAHDRVIIDQHDADFCHRHRCPNLSQFTECWYQG